jgi:hypothetical protein
LDVLQGQLTDDYQVAYKLKFEPKADDLLGLEIWITPEGHVAVGLGTREGVARRLNRRRLRFFFGRDAAFSVGSEPRRLSSAALIRLASAVADGQIAIAARTFPMLGKMRALVASGAFAADTGAELHEYGAGWLGDRDEFYARRLVTWRVVEFRPWR